MRLEPSPSLLFGLLNILPLLLRLVFFVRTGGTRGGKSTNSVKVRVLIKDQGRVDTQILASKSAEERMREACLMEGQGGRHADTGVEVGGGEDESLKM